MKLLALLGASALAAGTMVAAPASAQHYGHGGYHRGHGYHGGYGYGGGYRHAGGYRHGYYGRGPGWRGGYRHCRVHYGYHRAARRCY